MGKWDYNKTEQQFRERWVDAQSNGKDPLDVVGRQWGEDGD